MIGAIVKLTPFWLKYRLRRLVEQWPLVRRTTMRREANRAREEGQRLVVDNLEEERKTVRSIIDRLHTPEFRFSGRDRQEYEVTVRFRPALFTQGRMSTDEHRYIARHIGAQIEREIATAKFIREAYERESREGPRFASRDFPQR